MRNSIAYISTIALTLFACCLWAQEPVDTSLEAKLQYTDVERFQDSVLQVMGDYSYAPYEFLNTQGEPDGFNVDIMKAVARAMHLKVEITMDSWAEVRKAIEEGSIDIAMGMYKTKERDKVVDFSIPHFISSYAIFVRKGQTIETVEELRDMKILVQDKDLAHDFLLENKVGREIIPLSDWRDILRALDRGEGDCAIVSRLQGVHFVEDERLKRVVATGPPILQRKYCMAIQKGNESLLAEINEGLSIIKANGEYDKIYRKWFGSYDSEEVNWVVLRKYLLFIGLPLMFFVLLFMSWSYMLGKQVRIRTLALKQELQRRKQTEQRLRANELDLKNQNEEYIALNEELTERNDRILLMNEALNRAKAKAEENDKLKTAFLANMSHEIRTPMNGIIGFSKLLQDTITHKQGQKYADIISQSANRLLRLLNDLIDISKIETGQMEIYLQQVGLQDFVQEWIDFYTIQAESKNINLVSQLPEMADKMLLKTDKERLGQVLNNLLSNAFKHTKEGAIEVGCSVNGNMLKFWVADTGPGIDIDFQKLVFNRFQQGAKSHFKQVEGAGLGLAISKSIIEMLGGDMGLESTPGKGSTFWFTHPYRPTHSRGLADL